MANSTVIRDANRAIITLICLTKGVAAKCLIILGAKFSWLKERPRSIPINL